MKDSEQITVTKEYDVIVVGGGTTGVCAAVAAARSGAKTALFELQGFLGGNACNGMAWYGFHAAGSFEQVVGGLPLEIIERLREIDGASEFCPDPVAGSMVQVNTTLLKLVLAEMCLESGVEVHLHSMLTGVPECGKERQIITVQSRLETFRFASRVLIDCTDSADAAAAAGADYIRGRESDGKMQVASSTLFVSGVDMDELLAYFDEHPDELRPIPVPEDELRALVKRMHSVPVFGMGAFPTLIAKAKREGLTDYPRDRLVGQAFVRTGEMMLVASRVEDADPDDERAYTRSELTGTLQMKATLKLLREYLPGCRNARISGSGHTIGLRETRHIAGDYTLTGGDLLDGKEFPDCVARGAYHLDVHSPDHPGIETGRPPVYQIPYRSMLPKGLDGLLVAGRCYSQDQAAQASTRVIPIAGASGQAVGTAAGLAVRSHCPPREVDVSVLLDTLKKNGAIL